MSERSEHACTSPTGASRSWSSGAARRRSARLAGRAAARVRRPQPRVRDAGRAAGHLAGPARRRRGLTRLDEDQASRRPGARANPQTRYILIFDRRDISSRCTGRVLTGRRSTAMGALALDDRRPDDARVRRRCRPAGPARRRARVAVLASDGRPSWMWRASSGQPLQVSHEAGMLTITYEDLSWDGLLGGCARSGTAAHVTITVPRELPGAARRGQRDHHGVRDHRPAAVGQERLPADSRWTACAARWTPTPCPGALEAQGVGRPADLQLGVR